MLGVPQSRSQIALIISYLQFQKGAVRLAANGRTRCPHAFKSLKISKPQGCVNGNLYNELSDTSKILAEVASAKL